MLFISLFLRTRAGGRGGLRLVLHDYYDLQEVILQKKLPGKQQWVRLGTAVCNQEYMRRSADTPLRLSGLRGFGYFPDGVIIGVRHIHIAGAVHRHAAGAVKSRL